MIDDRLELRLRNDPTGDPVHEPGRFRERMAMAAGVRARPSPRIAFRPVTALVAVALVATLVLVVRPAIDGPGETPPPTPTPSITPLPTAIRAALEDAVQRWMLRFGQVNPPPISVSIVGPDVTSKATYTAGISAVVPPSSASGRIGEISRVYIAAAMAVVDDCARAGHPLSCDKPVFGTTMQLDDPVGRWYADWPDGDPTTVRQLLEGSSGLAPIAPSILELADRVGARPQDDWRREAQLAAAIGAPRRFEPGSQRAPVDTEWLILESVLAGAVAGPVSSVIPTDGSPPYSTSFADQATQLLMPGSRANGDPVADLDPTILSLVGNAGGMAASSDDLAEYALEVWGAAVLLKPTTVALLSDAANGHANPPGAAGECPCDGDGTRLLIRATGHAVGWTSVMAWNFDQGTGIGIVLGRDWRDDDVAALLSEIMAIPIQ